MVCEPRLVLSHWAGGLVDARRLKRRVTPSLIAHLKELSCWLALVEVGLVTAG